ncbi:MAG: hypothetical protein ACTSV5_05220 [Promethearchaeota archaeon]
MSTNVDMFRIVTEIHRLSTDTQANVIFIIFKSLMLPETGIFFPN